MLYFFSARHKTGLFYVLQMANEAEECVIKEKGKNLPLPYSSEVMLVTWDVYTATSGASLPDADLFSL